ncbi:MAG: hypothetical protein CVV49_07085 [Spirochaetae bacterium HGW-Spirochaetae-5]|nr:MAG: hypothetical protein CVV49_07085 [Spirochaetae bacterium HGW-Spirochaetae-5]
MAENGLIEQIKLMIEKAERSLDAAKNLIDDGDYDFSSSRSYYSAFYSLQALLLTKNLVFSKHSGVIAGFSEHFIRNGVFPVQYAKYISRLFRERHIGDYDFISVISREDAEKDY